PLGFLSAADIGVYLARRFSDHGLPAELALLLHRHTDGNPLFLVNTIDDLIGQGQLREVDGQWRLTGAVEDITARTPPTLLQLVDKQVERLTADEQAVLVAASVAGMEFSTAIVIGLRVGLHLRTAECLEAGYGDRAGEIAGELAVHFEHGRDFDRAALYRAQAGEHVLHQHAYREAADHATRGLASLRALPDSPERARRELALQVTRGAGLTAIEGYGAPEVARTYARAWELCTQIGEP